MKYTAKDIRSVKDYVKMPFLFNHWYVAGMGEEFDRTPKERTLLERSLVFYRTEAGELVALQNRCLHRSFPLSESKLVGDNLVCGYHGTRYDPEGTLVGLPAQDSCPKRKLRKYAIREIGPFAFIWMGEEGSEDESKLPDLPFLEDDKFRTIFGEKPLEGNYLLMQENLNDLTHFSYLHAETFGFTDEFIALPTEITKEGTAVVLDRYNTNWEQVKLGMPADVQEAVGERPIEKHDGGYSFSPGVFVGLAHLVVKNEDGEDDVFHSYVMHYLTPENGGKTHYWYSISNDYALDNDPYYQLIEAVSGVGFNEDVVAVKHMQHLLDNDKIEFEEMSLPGDRAGLLFRKVMLDWANEEYSDAPANEGSALDAPVQAVS